MKKIMVLALAFLCFFDLEAQRILKDNSNPLLSEVIMSSHKWGVRKAYCYVNDFIQTVSTTTVGSELAATNSGSGAATSAQATDAGNRIGLVRMTTGTTATGRTAINSAASVIRLGGGETIYEAEVNVTTLSTGTERYQLLIGLFDGFTGVNQTDAVYFLYDEGQVSTGSAAATYWQTCTANNSTRTFNTSITQTTVAAATWVQLKIVINAAGNSVGFYVNNTLISTHTANIPTSAGRETGFGLMLIKSVGTTARTVDVDWMAFGIDYTTDK